MPKTRPPYIQKEITKNGKIFWYVRKRPNPRIRIRGEYGSPEFIKAYEAAIIGADQPKRGKCASGSLGWLIEQYRKSSAWLSYSQSTKKQRDAIFYHIVHNTGDAPISAITRQVIAKSADARASAPHAAKNFLKAMGGLFKWAVEAEYAESNPCSGVKPPKPKNSEGFAAWTEDDIAAYEARWPLGTKERVWLDVLLYTGLRRGDAVRIGRQHIRNGIATLRTEKSGFKVEVNLPILPILQKTLNAGPTGDLAFICGANRQPLAKGSFGAMFVAAAKKAGVHKSAHGIRKIAATRAANAGATVAQLKAIFGWTSDSMPSLYTKTADRKRLAAEAIEKLQKGA